MGILAVSRNGIMTIFDVIILIYGAYTVYTALQMKKTGEPAKWLVNEQEIGRCKDKRGFVDAIYAATILFGVVTMLYGVVSLLTSYVFRVSFVDMICLIVFLASCVFYMVTLNRARKKFF